MKKHELQDIVSTSKYSFDVLQETDLVMEDYFTIPLVLLISDTYPNMLGKKNPNFTKEAITYALIQDLYNLSKLNAERYTDDDGRLFCCLTINDLCKLTGFSKRTAITIFDNLEAVGLVERVSQGPNKPWRIYIHEYDPMTLDVRDKDKNTKNIAFKMPYIFLKEQPFTSLSIDARILYAYMFNLTVSSFRNQLKYSDEKGVYIIIPNEEICALLQIKKDKATECVKELSTDGGIGLVDVVRQSMPGKNYANKYYVKNFKKMTCAEVQNSDDRECKKPTTGGAKNRPPEVQNSDHRECKKPTTEGAEFRPPEVQNSDTNRFIYNNFKLTDSVINSLDKREREEIYAEEMLMGEDTSPTSPALEEVNDELIDYISIGPGPRKNLRLTQEDIDYIREECNRDSIDFDLVIKQASMKKRAEEKKGRFFTCEDDFDIVLLKLSDYQKELADRRLVRQAVITQAAAESSAENLFISRFNRKPNDMELEMLNRTISEWGFENVKQRIQDISSISELRTRTSILFGEAKNRI